VTSFEHISEVGNYNRCHCPENAVSLKYTTNSDIRKIKCIGGFGQKMRRSGVVINVQYSCTNHVFNTL
jgi:hypothetical protein